MSINQNLISTQCRRVRDRKQKTGDRRQETGNRRQKTGDRKQETEDRRRLEGWMCSEKSRSEGFEKRRIRGFKGSRVQVEKDRRLEGWRVGRLVGWRVRDRKQKTGDRRHVYIPGKTNESYRMKNGGKLKLPIVTGKQTIYRRRT